MSVLIGLLTLPILLWSWLVRKNEEDGDLALGILAWVLLAAIATAIGWWWFS